MRTSPSPGAQVQPRRRAGRATPGQPLAHVGVTPHSLRTWLPTGGRASPQRGPWLGGHAGRHRRRARLAAACTSPRAWRRGVAQGERPVGRRPARRTRPAVLGRSAAAAARRAFVPGAALLVAAARHLARRGARGRRGPSIDASSRVVVAGPDPTALWTTLGVSPADTTRTRRTSRTSCRAVEGSRRVLGLVPAQRRHARTCVRCASTAESLFGGDRLRTWRTGRSCSRAPPRRRRVWLRRRRRAPVDRLRPGRDVDAAGRRRRHARPRGVPPGRAPGQGPGPPLGGRLRARSPSRTCCTVDGGDAIRTRVAGPAWRRARAALRRPTSRSSTTRARRPTTRRYHPHGPRLHASTRRSSRGSPMPASIS